MVRPMQGVSQREMDQAVSSVRRVWPQAKPGLGIVLGSGWGGAVENFSVRAELPYEGIPHLGKSGAPGHAGRLIYAERDGLELFIFQGRRHLYEGAGWMPVVLPIWMMKQFGVQTVLLTNASGGIRDDLQPGALMAIEDHISLLGGSPLTGPHDPAFGERFPDQSAIYDRDLRQVLILSGAEASGIYLATPGPSFETPAEIRAFRAIGADAVGMSTVPEAIFANALGLNVAGLSCICNRAAGLGNERLTAEDVIRTAGEAAPRMRAAIQTFCRLCVL